MADSLNCQMTCNRIINYKRCEIKPIITQFYQYGLVRIQSLRTGTHKWGNNAWIAQMNFGKQSRRAMIFDPLGRRD